jgi:putative ABC transport system substrate-binding protein
MRRREWLAMMGAAALLPGAAGAKERPFRIYMATWRGMTDVERGFQDYLAKRAVPVEYVWRDAGQERAKLAEFLREIRESKPDLVYAWGTSATLGLAGPYDQPTTLSVPLVFALVAQPIAAKIVPRLRGQGRDVTGVYHVAPVGAQLEAMGAYLPFNRVGVLYNDTEANSAAIVEELRGEMKRRRMQLIAARFRLDSAGRPLADGIEERVHEIAQAGAQWLYLGPDSYLFTQIDRIAAAAAHERLPTFATTEALLEGSAPVLAGLISRYRSVGEFAAHKAEQILAGGRRARDVPVETLARFAFVVRVDVARGIDVLPPITLFNYAEFR